MQKNINQAQGNFYQDNIVYRELQQFFDLGRAVFDFGNGCADDVKHWKVDESLESHLRDVVSGLYSSSLKTFRSILFLSNQGHGEDAMNLTRTIFDNYLTLRYIQENPKDNIYRFKNYSVLETKFMLDRAKNEDSNMLPEIKKIVLQKETEILQNYNKIKTFYVRQGEDDERSLRKFKSGRWAGINRRRMAEDTCLVVDYDCVFHFHSCFIHPHPYGLSGFREETESEVRFGAKASSEEVFPALPVAMRYFLLILKEWAKLLQLDKDTQIEIFLSEVVKLETEHINKMELFSE